MAILQRLRDFLYAGFLLVHLAAATLFDTQLILDRKLFPKVATDLLDQYIRDFKDPLFASPPIWFKSLLYCELLFQVPFCVIGFFGALAGARWMRTPTLIYAASVLSMVAPMLGTILQENFKGRVGPSTNEERFPLLAIYGGFALGALIMLLDHALLRPQQHAAPARQGQAKSAQAPAKSAAVHKEGNSKKKN